MTRKQFLNARRIVILIVCALASTGCAAGEIAFADVQSQSRQFMDWEQTIRLTPEQEAIKKQALGAMPAPCCSDNSAYTCCCPCNLSRTIWGLANYLIAEQGAGVKKVQAKTSEWVAFVNPKGFSGDTCYRGGCPRPFKNNGCGGMKANQVNF